MNASCIICSDLFTPRSEIFTTTCGHLFHQHCLKQWIDRSKTCPQCRHKETHSSIHRLYLNFASAEGIADDIVTLQSKLDTVKFEISVKDRDIAKYTKKYQACKVECSKMRESIVEMEQEQREHEASMLALQYQMRSYQDKVRDKDKLLNEIEVLKKQIDSMDHLKTLVSNCDESVTKMMNMNNDPESLKILVLTLKRQLEETKGKNQSMSTQIYRIGKQMISTNATVDKLRERSEQSKSALSAHQHCASEISYLKEKIFKAKGDSTTSNATITSGARQNGDNSCIILDDSLPGTPSTSRSAHEETYTPELPSTSENTNKSPTVTELRTHFERPIQPRTSTPLSKPIRATQPCTSTPLSKPIRATQPCTSTPFSKPTSSAAGMKRTKSTSSFTSARKFRKLAPGNARKPS